MEVGGLLKTATTSRDEPEDDQSTDKPVSDMWMGAAGGGGQVSVVTTIDELESKLLECDEAIKVSDDALRASFRSFRMDFSASLPEDPFSPEYRDFQLNLYERIAGKAYRPANEVTPIDWQVSWIKPFPYYTGSTATTGIHLGAMAFLFRTLELAPGARILEFGPGWGNTTIALAQLGMKVTAVDIEMSFCDIIKMRAQHEQVDLEVVHGSFFYAETVKEPYDAVIFFECFHHCDDHLRLLRALRTAVKPGGHVYFGAEPVIQDYPVPWGLRMDPEALWAIRRMGWLELGFDENYFKRALSQTGWSAIKRVSLDYPWINVWVAQRSDTSASAASDGSIDDGGSGGILTAGNHQATHQSSETDIILPVDSRTTARQFHARSLRRLLSFLFRSVRH